MRFACSYIQGLTGRVWFAARRVMRDAQLHIARFRSGAPVVVEVKKVKPRRYR